MNTPLPAHCMQTVGTWLSLVEHSLGVRGVGSSNLPVPTIISSQEPFPSKKYATITKADGWTVAAGGPQGAPGEESPNSAGQCAG